ncbi:hypothetical protein ACWDYH_36675 [Nocardia goodfellowii]
MLNSQFANRRESDGSPRSPLEVVRSSFDRIAEQSLPLGQRPAPSPAAIAGSLSWGGLRALLWDRAVPIAEKDAIWGWLIGRARTHGEDAMLVCAGLAVPMLARTAERYAALDSSHRHDVEAEVLAGFLFHLGRVDVDAPRLWHRLRLAAFRAALEAVGQQYAGAMSAGDLERDLGPLDTQAQSVIAEPGHPEMVLAQAVAAGVISTEAAELIAASRWEGRSLTALAAERGVSVWKLRKQRPRAERALLAWLTERARDLDPERTSTVEAHAVTAFAAPLRSPRRGRRPAQHSPVAPQPSTTQGQVAA